MEKIRKYEEKEPFEKTLSSFKKTSLPKREGKKYAGGSRSSCYHSNWNIVTQS